jgi:hypothetical protein
MKIKLLIIALVLLCVIVPQLFSDDSAYADSVDLHWIGGTGNWTDTAHWATVYTTGTASFVNGDATVEGAGGCNWVGKTGYIRVASTGTWYTIGSITDADTLELTGNFAEADTGAVAYVIATTGHAAPTSSNNVYFNVGSFTGAGQIVTVNATAYCKAMDWTGAINNPTLTSAVGVELRFYGNLTIISAMSITGFAGTGASISAYASCTITTNNNADLKYFIFTNASSCTVVGNWNTSFALYIGGGTHVLAGITVTAPYVSFGSSAAKTVDITGSTFNLSSGSLSYGWNYSGSNMSLTSTGSTINIAGTGGFVGGGLSYNDVNLNGTAHSVTGSNTFVNLTRTGTATKTDSVSFDAHTTTITGTLTLNGNSSINRLLVQSSSLGVHKHLTAANVSVSNADFMDITGDGAGNWDLSAIAGLSGDAQGNSGITFTAPAAQTSSKASTWSDATMWTSRVPLPQDDVTCSHNVTINMPRIGKSITFTGTPIVTKSISINIYGSLTMPAGMNYVNAAYTETFRGRGSYELNTDSVSLRQILLYNPTGTYTLLSNLSVATNTSIIGYGFDTGGFTVAFNLVQILATANINLRNSTVSISGYTAGYGWDVQSDSATVDADTSTIVFTNITANPVSFIGASKIYNSVTVQGAGNYALTITGNNTFNTFTVDTSAAAKTITGTAGSIQTVTSFTHTGNNTLTMNSTGAAWTLTKSGGGTNAVDYIDLSNNTGLPVSTWYYGTHNTIGANVTNWNAASSPTVTTSAVTSVESTTATGNGNVNSTGGDNPTVTVYWGDNDGGIIPGNWDNNSAPTNPAQPQGVAAFTKSLASLPTGKVLYFSAVGTNMVGSGWGTTQTFLTKPAEPTDVAASDGTFTDKVRITWTKSFGATDYHIWRDAVDLGSFGDVDLGDDTGASAGTITPGTATATDGTSTAHVTLSIAGESTSNGTIYTYKVISSNSTGNSIDSATDTGYRGIGALTYQWYRSAGIPDASFGIIAGANTSPYNDNTAPPPTITVGATDASQSTYPDKVVCEELGDMANNGGTRYFYCVLSATGAISQDTTHDNGYIGIGALTYQWQRSAGDSDALYSDLVGGTTDPYSDMSPAMAGARFYRCIIDATGAVQVISSGVRGWITGAVVVLPDPPTDFTIIQTGADTATITWTKGAYAATTIIRGKDNGKPASITDGYEIYNGPLATVNLTGLNFDTNRYYYRAWSHNAIGYSTLYTEEDIGGTTMQIILLGILILFGLACTIAGYALRIKVIGIMGIGAWVASGAYSYTLSSSTWDVYYGLFFLMLGIAMSDAIGFMLLKDKPENERNKIYLQREGKPKRERVQDEDLWETEKSDGKDQYQFYREQMDSMRTKPIGNRRRLKRIRESRRIDRTGRI